MQESIAYRTKPVIEYKDLYFRLIACYIASHIIVAYGVDIPFSKMLVMPYYHYAVIMSFPIALALFAIIKAISIRLDKKFDWTEKTIQRISTQVFFGFVVPAVCAFILAYFYFIIRGRDIFSTTYLQWDYWFILAQLLLINLYYIIYYFYQKWFHAERTISLLELNQNSNIELSRIETFTVTKGDKSILIILDQIAYFFRVGESNFLRTVEREDFFIVASLDEIQQQLPEEKFFRANRQLIVHRQACKGFSLLTYGKLEANLVPPLSNAIVSQKRAGSFKKWIESR